MARESVARSPRTREEKGLELARSRPEEIWSVGPALWRVPSSDGETIYIADLRRERCCCEDFRRRELPCKHLYAAWTVRAKTAPCSGCGRRFRPRDLYPVGDEHLTFFEGDQLCKECAGAHGVL